MVKVGMVDRKGLFSFISYAALLPNIMSWVWELSTITALYFSCILNHGQSS